MSNFEVLVVRIDNAYDHPDADRLTIVEIGGYLCVANKHEDGTPRYKTGDLVVYIPEQAVLPEWLMRKMDMWDENKNKPTFRYVKSKRLRGVFSQGILYPVEKTIYYDTYDESNELVPYHEMYTIDNGIQIEGNVEGSFENTVVAEGDDVSEFLGIIKYEPIVPASMSGQLSGEYIKYAKVFDTESIQKCWNMFEEGEWVSVTEKVHGTQLIVEYIPGIDDPFLFGETHTFAVTSKGVGAKGFIYKNIAQNTGNIYVTTLLGLLAAGLEARVMKYIQTCNTVHLMGEIFGAGVQDLSYGQKTPIVQFFDIAVDKNYIAPDVFFDVIGDLNLEHVPVLYEGPFNKKLIEELRDGLDFSGTHIREGIVIKGLGDHPKYGRKVAKWVSPEYTLRKGNTTEFQ